MLKLSEVIAKMKMIHDELCNLETYLTFKTYKEEGMLSMDIQGDIESIREVAEIIEREVSKLGKKQRELQEDKAFTDLWNNAIILGKEEKEGGEGNVG